MILENPRFWKDFVDSNNFDISWQNVDGGGIEYSQLFLQIEANVGFDIIPDYKNATKQIKKDTYRKDSWSLNPFEFRYGFAVHFGLDF